MLRSSKVGRGSVGRWTVAAGALIVALTVTASASNSFATIIEACQRRNGRILIVDPKGSKGPAHCDQDETLITWNVQGLTGQMGQQGPAGPVGQAGPAGQAGSAGPAGPLGPIGSAGPSGPSGPMGNAGAAGLTGPAGPSGPMGDTGAAGPTGPAGPSGPMGDTGAAGLTGPAGPSGPMGDTGAAGPTGPSGPSGPMGDTGAAGPTGPSGSSGPIGNTGAAGPTGPAGADGASGATGATGPLGPSGPAGADGSAGATGATGPSGPTGATGSSSALVFGGTQNSSMDVTNPTYMGPGNGVLVTAVQTTGTQTVGVPMPVAGILSNLQIHITNPMFEPLGLDSWTFNVCVNNTCTNGLACTINSGIIPTTVCSDNVDTVSFAAGDLLTIQAVPTNNSGLLPATPAGFSATYAPLPPT